MRVERFRKKYKVIAAKPKIKLEIIETISYNWVKFLGNWFLKSVKCNVTKTAEKYQTKQKYKMILAN